jgi:hypothetical protein
VAIRVRGWEIRAHGIQTYFVPVLALEFENDFLRTELRRNGTPQSASG